LETGFQQQQRQSAPFWRVFGSSRRAASLIRRGDSIHQQCHALLALRVASGAIKLRGSRMVPTTEVKVANCTAATPPSRSFQPSLKQLSLRARPETS
jgi:hypothetical protein